MIRIWHETAPSPIVYQNVGLQGNAQLILRQSTILQKIMPDTA